jgi:glycosyltransferase involved in cell wall biosynthesis
VRAPAGSRSSVIVADDGSDDGSAEAARRALAELPAADGARVAVHAFRERLGLAGNWNRVLRLARGDYVCLFGHDDRCRPGFAEQLVPLLERHRDCALAFGRREFELADEATRRAMGEFFERRYPEMIAPFEARLRATAR